MIEWINIIAGLILCVGFLEAIPKMGKHLAKFAKWLGGFDTIIGIIIIIYVLWAGYWNSLQGILAMCIHLYQKNIISNVIKKIFLMKYNIFIYL